MKRTILAISLATIAIAAISVASFDQLMPGEEFQKYTGEPSYVPSDITKANEKFVISPAAASMKTTDISKAAEYTMISTFSGTVTEIGDPIDWLDNVRFAHGAIPITIQIDKNTKDVEDKKYKKGDSFTFYLDSYKYDDGNYYIPSFEAEFEVAEEVIVHIAKSQLDPLDEDGDYYYVELGDYGKYKIKDGKAYNKNFINGRSIDEALMEAR